jgi:hypothetical protein
MINSLCPKREIKGVSLVPHLVITRCIIVAPHLLLVAYDLLEGGIGMKLRVLNEFPEILFRDGDEGRVRVEVP